MPKSPVIKSIERKAGMGALLMVNAVARQCPEPLVAPLGKFLGRQVMRLSHRHRAVALKNLRFVFGNERTDGEIQKLMRAVFEHFGQVAVEFFWLQKASKKKIIELVQVPDKQPLEEAQNRGKGLICITAHFGNWELLARRAGAENYPLHVVARDSDDPTLNSWVNGIRAKGGMKIISRGDPAQRIMEVLKQNEFLGILPDQNTIENPIFVPFFGKVASTAPGIALLALRSGASMLPMFTTRTEKEWRLDFYPFVDIPTEGSLKDRIYQITADYTSVIESHIRKHPEQWLWFHDRWKRRPDGSDATDIGDPGVS